MELVALCGCGDINVSKLYSLCTAHSYCGDINVSKLYSLCTAHSYCSDINVSKFYSLCTAHRYCRHFAKVVNKISNIKVMLKAKQPLYKP